MPMQISRGKVQGETFRRDLMLLLFQFADRGCDSSKTETMAMTSMLHGEPSIGPPFKLLCSS